jgi:16S rRNA (uracil1498-N3)-methyltransferase
VQIPKVAPISDFGNLIATPHEVSLKLIFWEKEGGLTMSEVAKRWPDLRSCMLVVGAEGGFSVAEIERAKAGGFLPVWLGLHTLRCETAAIVVVALAQHLWGDLP